MILTSQKQLLEFTGLTEPRMFTTYHLIPGRGDQDPIIHEEVERAMFISDQQGWIPDWTESAFLEWAELNNVWGD